MFNLRLNFSVQFVLWNLWFRSTVVPNPENLAKILNHIKKQYLYVYKGFWGRWIRIWRQFLKQMRQTVKNKMADQIWCNDYFKYKKLLYYGVFEVAESEFDISFLKNCYKKSKTKWRIKKDTIIISSTKNVIVRDFWGRRIQIWHNFLCKYDTWLQTKWRTKFCGKK